MFLVRLYLKHALIDTTVSWRERGREASITMERGSWTEGEEERLAEKRDRGQERGRRTKGRREGEKERGREGGKERGREVGKERGREGEKEGGREGERKEVRGKGRD